MFMNLEHIYFAEERNNASERKNLVCYHQTKRPMQSLQTQKTLQIMLQQDEEILLANLSKMNRYMLRRAKKEPYEVIVKENPSDQELLEFQQFYNAFAKVKNTDRVRKFHLQTLKLLREKGALVYTKLQNDEGEALCYRLYIVDEDIVFNLYTGTAIWIKDRTDLKQQIRFANRYLLWENIMMFRSRGYERYDFGAVTNKEEINEFKLGFGAQEVEVYHGYLTDSILGKLILRLRDLKFKMMK
ncbi:hypothetical protein [Lysinibacillus sp. RC79]|uniref:hypothetical protein n=1 Tax=Lysinibacillus sp. RC79 TaxID=3156296 RepID=UPI003517E24E